MKRKIFIVIFLCIAGVVLLVSCSDKIEKEEGRPVKLRVAFFGDIRNKPLGEALIKAFNKINPQIQAEGVYTARDYDSKLLTMIAGGDSPDIMVLRSSLMVNLASRGILLNLDSYMTRDAAQGIICDKKVDIPVNIPVANSSSFINKFSRIKENKVFLDGLTGAEEYPYHFAEEDEWMSIAIPSLSL